MNRLYSILVDGRDISSSWYKKKTEYVVVTGAADKLRNYIMPSSCDAALNACCIAYLALESNFGESIASLDPVNTYCKPSRHGSGEEHRIPTTSTLESCRNMLDADIREQLNSPSLSEWLGAICLQLLRMCND